MDNNKIPHNNSPDVYLNPLRMQPQDFWEDNSASRIIPQNSSEIELCSEVRHKYFSTKLEQPVPVPNYAPGHKFGSYRVIKELGRGGMGIVLQVYDSTSGREMALKTMAVNNLPTVKRFMREATSMARLYHPYIVKIYDIVHSEQFCYFTMEFIEGPDLQQLLRIEKPDVYRSASLLCKVAKAISCAHRHGILHRDIKPANILIDKQGNPKVTDFGLARDIEYESRLSRSGYAIGTPCYMPPEALENRNVDIRSDVYALGAVLYQLLTGVAPFRGRSLQDILLQVLNDEIVSPGQLARDIPTQIEQICVKAMAKRQEHRYANVEEMLQALERFLQNAPAMFEEDAQQVESSVPLQNEGKMPVTIPCDPDNDVDCSITAKIFARYQIQQEIGSGGMGRVYKAYDPQLDRFVALKVLLSGSLANHDELERFMREAKATANLHHPHIVTVHDIGREAGKYFFTMDFLEGGSLESLLKKAPLTIRQSVDWMITIGNAVQYAHKQGIIHRDLKPSNIMFDENNQIQVMDFGLAKSTREDKQLSRTGTVIGTPTYMPPEQAKGRIKDIDKRSDVYALGAIFYEMLTGRPPFIGSNVFQLLYQIMNHDVLAPTQIKPRIPRDLESICLKALAKSKAWRYRSVGEFVHDLSRFAEGKPVKARPLSAMDRIWRKIHHHRRVVAAIIALVVLNLLLTTRLWRSQTEFYARYPHWKIRAKIVQSQQPQKVFNRYQPLRLHLWCNFRDIPEMAAGHVEISGNGIRHYLENYPHLGKMWRNKLDLPIQIRDSDYPGKLVDATTKIETNDYPLKFKNGTHKVFLLKVRIEVVMPGVKAVSKSLSCNLPLRLQSKLVVCGCKPIYRQQTPSLHKNSAHFTRIGFDFYNAGKFSAAIDNFSQAIKLNARDHWAYLNRGASHYRHGRLHAAVADFTKALTISANNAIAYKNRGLVYFQQQNWQHAQRDLFAYLQLQPDAQDAHTILEYIGRCHRATRSSK